MTPGFHARGPFLATLEPVARLGGRDARAGGGGGSTALRMDFFNQSARGRAAMWGCVTMPDDMAQWAKLRGADAVTIRAPGGGRMQRHAAWRQPATHDDAPRIDKLYAAREITDREYQNACAVMELCRAAGMTKSQGVAEWLRVQGHVGGTDATPEDELRALIRTGGVDFQAVLMLLDPAEPPVLPYMWSRARRGLAKLDALAERWDGQRWGEE